MNEFRVDYFEKDVYNRFSLTTADLQTITVIPLLGDGNVLLTVNGECVELASDTELSEFIDILIYIMDVINSEKMSEL